MTANLFVWSVLDTLHGYLIKLLLIFCGYGKGRWFVKLCMGHRSFQLWFSSKDSSVLRTACKRLLMWRTFWHLDDRSCHLCTSWNHCCIWYEINTTYKLNREVLYLYWSSHLCEILLKESEQWNLALEEKKGRERGRKERRKGERKEQNGTLPT